MNPKFKTLETKASGSMLAGTLRVPLKGYHKGTLRVSFVMGNLVKCSVDGL